MNHLQSIYFKKSKEKIKKTNRHLKFHLLKALYLVKIIGAKKHVDPARPTAGNVNKNMPKPNNPPAFPVSASRISDGQGNICITTGNCGMDLRDYFAAKAMQSFIIKENNWSSPLAYGVAVTRSYDIADAMLAEREK